MANVRIEIPGQDVAGLRIFAERRDLAHERQSSSHTPHKSVQLMGLLGEYAFMELTGLPMDLEHRIDGDGGIDFRSRGHAIDVKALRGRNYGITKRRDTRDGADLFVLFRTPKNLDGDLTTPVDLLGWCSVDAFQGREPVILTKGGFPSLAVPEEEQCTDFERLFAMLDDYRRPRQIALEIDSMETRAEKNAAFSALEEGPIKEMVRTHLNIQWEIRKAKKEGILPGGQTPYSNNTKASDS